MRRPLSGATLKKGVFSFLALRKRSKGNFSKKKEWERGGNWELFSFTYVSWGKGKYKDVAAQKWGEKKGPLGCKGKATKEKKIEGGVEGRGEKRASHLICSGKRKTRAHT